MNDRELLELAAKAAEVEIDKSPYNGGGHGNIGFDVMGNAVLDWHNGTKWNPLADDGDALRLAVTLGISITPYPIYRSDARHAVVAKQRRSGDTLRELNPTETLEPYGDNPCAATRRAIVRAAAEIGKGTP